jgi:hypothetical protein
MTAAHWSLIVVAVAVSFAAGRWQSPVVAPVAAPVAPPGRAVAAAGAGLTANDVRAAVRDELRRTPSIPAAGCEPSEPAADSEADPGAPPSAPFLEAQSIVTAAVDRARWTAADARALTDVLRTLEPDENRRVTRALYTAANAGHLVVETGGPLLAAHSGD